MIRLAPLRAQARDRHEAHRTNTDDKDRIAKLDISLFDGVEARRNHIRHDACVNRIHALRQMGQVAIRIIDMEEISKDTIFIIGEFPTAEHTA